MLPNDSADIPAGATNTTTPMSDPTETARRVLSGHPSLPASEDLARALLETQAQMTEVMHEICRLQPNGSPPPGGLANHAAWCVQSAQAALAAANARADAAEAEAASMADTFHGRTLELMRAYEERDALRAQVEALTAERDALHDDLHGDHGSMAKEIEQKEIREKEVADHAAMLGCEEEWSNGHDHGECVPVLIADLHTRAMRLEHEMLPAARAEAESVRESVRELVDGLRDAIESQKPRTAGCACCEFWTAKIDALLAKHATPAPMPDKDEEAAFLGIGAVLQVAPTPAAVPGLVFGAPDAEGARTATATDGRMYVVFPSFTRQTVWFWRLRMSPQFRDEGECATESEAIAAANAHNAARLDAARQGSPKQGA